MKKNNFARTKIFLFLIILLAGFLRFYKLEQHPAGFHIDEASLGYNAYSLLKTGRDENNNFLPLHIDMFGDQRPAGYQYLTVLPVRLLGLTELATRFPSALFGVLTIIAIFLLAKTIFKDEILGLLTAGLLAISPWHVVISRASAETIVALFFIILGTHFFLTGIKGKRSQFFWATIFWVVSLFFYHSSRVFVPLLALVFLVYTYSDWQKKEKSFKRRLIVSWLVVLFLSAFLVFGTGAGAGRFQQVSIFHYPEIRLVLEEQIREDGVTKASIVLTRIYHNKLVNYGLGYFKEYLRYFSPHFLFVEGGLPAWYLVPNMGLMYAAELPFLLIGLHFLIKKKGWGRLAVFWLVLGPMVAGMTRDDVPNVQRSLVMLPALILITAYGFQVALDRLRNHLQTWVFRLAVLTLLVVFAWNLTYFLHQYFVHARVHRPWYRFNGFKQMVLAVNEMEADYDKVVVSKDQGGTYMHFLFFQKYDPGEYQRLGSPKDKDYSGFGKLIFVPQACPTSLPGSTVDKTDKILYVASGTCAEPAFTSEEVRLIKREDGTIAFRISPSEP